MIYDRNLSHESLFNCYGPVSDETEFLVETLYDQINPFHVNAPFLYPRKRQKTKE